MSLGQRLVHAQPQPPVTVTLSCLEVGEGLSSRLRLLVPFRLAPAPSCRLLPLSAGPSLGSPPTPGPLLLLSLLPLVLAGPSLSFGSHQLTPDTSYAARTGL